MTGQIDLLRLSELLRDTVLNSKPEYLTTTFENDFETDQGGHDERPAFSEVLPVFPVPKTTLKLRDDDGIAITIEATGHDAVARLANTLSGV